MASYSTDVLYTTTYSSTMQYAKNMTKKRTQPRDSFSLKEGRGEGGGGGMQMCANGISAPARF